MGEEQRVHNDDQFGAYLTQLIERADDDLAFYTRNFPDCPWLVSVTAADRAWLITERTRRGGMSWDRRVSDLRAPRPDDHSPAPRRARPKRGCHASRGGAHRWAIRLDRRVDSIRRYGDGRTGPRMPAGWKPGDCWWSHWYWRITTGNNGWRYCCNHELYCTACGKIAHRRVKPEQCPDYPGPAPTVSAEELSRSRARRP